MIKDIDFVECPICGHIGQRLVRHIKGKHGMSFDEFKVNYPDCETTCKVVRDRIKSKTKESVNTTSCREKSGILLKKVKQFKVRMVLRLG